MATALDPKNDPIDCCPFKSLGFAPTPLVVMMPAYSMDTKDARNKRTAAVAPGRHMRQQCRQYCCRRPSTTADSCCLLVSAASRLLCCVCYHTGTLLLRLAALCCCVYIVIVAVPVEAEPLLYLLLETNSSSRLYDIP